MNRKQIKVLIGNDTAELGVRIAAKLREAGLYAYTRPKDADVIFDCIKKEYPDIVLIDVSSEDYDVAAFIQKTSELTSNKTKFIVISPEADRFRECRTFKNGTSYYITNAFEINELCPIVMLAAEEIRNAQSVDMEIIVTDIIRRFRVPAHIKGYHYLRTAILEVLEDASLLDLITKNLYPLVAAQYNTTASRVERAIRKAIETAWNRADIDFLNSFFGYSVNISQGKPTNAELISLIADKIKLHHEGMLNEINLEDYVQHRY
ncbi:MAG: sporulation transcription factor Spo0A [Ruminococcus sp.]|nr:sporulation transcription factor Spo0A [Ruminococcus sp.]